MKIVATVLLILLLQTNSAWSIGVYVRNLHKGCLSSHQKCVFKCAQKNEGGCTENGIAPAAELCNNICIEDYKACEKDLDTLRCLIVKNPVKPEYSANFKVEFPEEAEELEEDTTLEEEQE